VLLLDALAEGLARLEVHVALLGDLDLLAGGGVGPGAGSPLARGEGAEACDEDLAARIELGGCGGAVAIGFSAPTRVRPSSSSSSFLP
jgi:hypothetical protein